MSSGTVVLFGDLFVAYAQFYLNAADPADVGAYFRGPDGTGLIGAIGNGAVLATGLNNGYVTITVTVDAEDPGAALDEFDDVVEVSMSTPDERLMIFCWGGAESHDLSPLPAGGGGYRLRYHARAMDQARGAGYREIDDPPIDEYLLQVWPAVHAAPSVLQLTSQSARAFQTMW